VSCPKCGAPTPTVDIYEGAGASRSSEKADLWCTPCLAAKIADARADGDCRCAQIPGPHTHQAQAAVA
jgi:hypothetical protein